MGPEDRLASRRTIRRLGVLVHRHSLVKDGYFVNYVGPVRIEQPLTAFRIAGWAGEPACFGWNPIDLQGGWSSSPSSERRQTRRLVGLYSDGDGRVDSALTKPSRRRRPAGGRCRVGAFVYTVAHDTGATQIPGLDYTLQATSYEDLQAKYAQRIADNNAKIDATSDDYFLPWVQTVKPDGTTSVVSSCQQALVTQGAQGTSFVSINTFDLTKLEPPTRTVIGSNAGYIYASPTALYMAVDRTYEQDYLSGTSYYYGSSQAADSFVHKFNLNGADTSYIGSVTLTGHILNQFSMDESDGVLRVASTKGWVPDPSVISYLTTYGMQAGKLVQLGQVGGIGPQEDIRSVRFDGNRGYVVTFKKTDPLFVFDLTDATKPKEMGELQIPGFSTYMQRLDDTHVLAIGFTADDHESFAFFNGIQIQIFDVSDLANPKLAWKYVIGTRGSSSEALTNHLAFNYFAPKKMLALPITVCEGGGDGTYATNLTFAGVMAFDISLDTGIAEHGRLPFMDAGTVAATDNCDKWWTDSKSLVKRSIFMDDYIYGLSDTQMRVSALSAMSSVLKSLPLSSL